MGHGVFQKFTKTVASGATLSSEFDLGRAFGAVYLEVPSMTSNSQLFIQAALTSGGNYRRVTHPSINSSTVGVNDFSIPSSVTNRIVPLPNGHRFMKVEQTATADSGQSFTIICADF